MELSKKTFSMFSGFFIPMTLIFIMISISGILIEDMRDKFVLLQSDGETLAMAKVFTKCAGVIIFIILLIIGRIFSLRNICFAVFISFPIFIGMFALFVMPFIDPFQNWLLIFYYVGISLWQGGSFFFFWAFANNHFSFRQAGFYYPYFTILSILIHFPINTFILQKLNDHNLYLNVNLILFSLGVLIFGFYAYTDNLLPRIRHTLEERNDQINRLFGISYRFVIGFLTLSIAFLLKASQLWMNFITHLKYPERGEYESLSSLISNSINIFSIIMIAFLIVLSFLLYDQRGKGWRSAAYLTAGIISFCTLVWYGLNFMQPDLSILVDASVSHYVILSVITPIILILKEMSFIAVPKETRFITKTWVDLFFFTVGIAGAEIIIALFSTIFGSLLSAFPFMFIITLVMLALLLISTCIAGKRLNLFAH